jgi:hypothetical protein
MKNISILLSAMLLLLVMGCYEGIDPISQVDPGPDQGAPVVKIQFPADGTKIQVLEDVTSINIKFEVTDDIEIGSVKVDLDGTEIAGYSGTDFRDYRRFFEEFTYDNITTGMHVLTVTGTDLTGKSTSAVVNFEKEAPYEPKYAGEILYMPFDGEFIDLVNIVRPTVVGSPGFAGESLVGPDAYKGAEGAYLRFPTAELFGTAGAGPDEFSAVFWMKINNTPDRAGILVVGPPDEDAAPDKQNDRTSGFRFFRENGANGNQRFKLNVGRGDGDSWFDGGAAADVAPDGTWHHFAFSIANGEASVYVDGEVVSSGAVTGISWNRTDVLTIMSGGPYFNEWGHASDRSVMDELRLFDRALSQADIKGIIADESGAGYVPKYDREIFYLSFDGEMRDLVNNKSATVVGAPGFAGEGKEGGDAYAGAADSYLTYPTTGILGDEFSASFWMKLNTDPNRAGILVIGPPTEGAEPDKQNNRTSGFRFFREGSETSQIFKLNVGNGTGDVWFDGGATATINPVTDDWVHFAFTISGTECIVYINGEVVKQGEFAGVDWTDCDVLSVMSGAPRFTEWGHLSDQSYLDELRLFDKVLSPEEIQTIIADAQ